ncbi:MAG: long-chain fatty acid--CoA ligase [Alphaproteobacteria bacterium]|nr:MAG: long-chain fatty acid--CoA ligase [Alphaproteobacteria bacterium]
MFLERVERHPERPFLWARREGAFHALSWQETADRVARLAHALTALGVEPGDRVVLVSENRPEWLIADFAIMAAGAITVPAYVTNTSRDHLHILENSGARAAIISTARLARAFLPAAHQSDALGQVIAIEEPRLRQSINAEIHLWEPSLAAQSGSLDLLRDRAAALGRRDVACIIYTSGTGGAPKGVMISHGAILANCAGGMDVLEEIGLAGHRFLSFLPLSHAYEHSAGQMLPVAIGAEIAYAEGIDKLAPNMREMRPTVMVVVPRLFEMLRARVLRQVEKDGGLRKKLFDRAVALGTRRALGGPRLSPRERLEDRLLDLLVRARVRKGFGGRVRAMVSGGAPLNPDVGAFFMALGLPLLQGYGQTEAAPIISVNRLTGAKVHTVGPPLKGVEVRIAEDGEILVRGELVMNGYWQDPQATARAIQDGWLHTGDIGHIDADGHLVITDRKKDIIVSDKGENVSPQRIEGMLALEPEIGQVMVYGDRKPHLVALVVPDADWLAGWARAAGKECDLGSLAGDPDLKAALDVAVARVNKRLAPVERVRRFAIAREPFSIENEQMTPTLKVRRHVITAAYRDVLEGLYGTRSGQAPAGETKP